MSQPKKSERRTEKQSPNNIHIQEENKISKKKKNITKKQYKKNKEKLSLPGVISYESSYLQGIHYHNIHKEHRSTWVHNLQQRPPNDADK